jgi:hypothetical protein
VILNHHFGVLEFLFSELIEKHSEKKTIICLNSVIMQAIELDKKVLLSIRLRHVLTSIANHSCTTLSVVKSHDVIESRLKPRVSVALLHCSNYDAHQRTKRCKE